MEKCGKSAQKTRKNVENIPKDHWKNVENTNKHISNHDDARRCHNRHSPGIIFSFLTKTANHKEAISSGDRPVTF